MRVLVIHNQLWAHYKSKLFSEIYASIKQHYPQSTFLVTHIALHEASRSGMQDKQSFPYEYPYEVLFQKSLDEVGFLERLTALFRTFHTYQPTVLNVTGWFDWAQVLLMAYARLRGVKIVLSSESSVSDHNRSGLKEKIKKSIVGMADAFFCFGKSSVDYLLQLGIDRNKIKVDHAAVIDEEVIQGNYQKAQLTVSKHSNNIEGTFVYVGRLAPEKNLKMLLNTFIKMQDEEPLGAFWKLLLVGDGPERDNLQKQAAASRFAENITFTGGIPWYDIPNWLAQSDVLILPSLSEPWGLVVNEAMVCGMPVIVSENCGCTPDLVQQRRNGFTFNPHQPQDLAKAMHYFIHHPDQIKQMGAVSLQLIEPFSSKRVALEMAHCYHSL